MKSVLRVAVLGFGVVLALFFSGHAALAAAAGVTDPGAAHDSEHRWDCPLFADRAEAALPQPPKAAFLTTPPDSPAVVAWLDHRTLARDMKGHEALPARAAQASPRPIYLLTARLRR
jgi:hypothetical protein